MNTSEVCDACFQTPEAFYGGVGDFKPSILIAPKLGVLKKAKKAYYLKVRRSDNQAIFAYRDTICFQVHWELVHPTGSDSEFLYVCVECYVEGYEDVDNEEASA